MGLSTSHERVPPSSDVPTGITRLCVAGFAVSHHTARCHKIVAHLAEKYPSMFESWYYWAPADPYYAFLKFKFDSVPFPDHLKGHSTSPFAWLETADRPGTNAITPIGGRAEVVDWIKTNHADLLANDEALKNLVNTGPKVTEAYHGKKGAKATAAGAGDVPIN